jgi:hypothetical protein
MTGSSPITSRKEFMLTPDPDVLKKLKEILQREEEELAAVPDSPDVKDILEASAFERDRQALELQEVRQNIEERKRYARRLFIMLCLWLAIILLIAITNGIDNPFICIGFHVSEAVIITLITTTTANIAAFFLVVTRYLFPVSKRG